MAVYVQLMLYVSVSVCLSMYVRPSDVLTLHSTYVIMRSFWRAERGFLPGVTEVLSERQQGPRSARSERQKGPLCHTASMLCNAPH
jgi:hypothetical protein